MRKIIFILLLLQSFSSLSAKELIIDTIEIFPFGYVGSDGRGNGMIYEMSNLIAQTAGFTFKNRLSPYPRTISDLKNGQADFVIRYSNSELLKNAIPVAEIIGFNTIIIGKAGRHFKSLNELHGKTVGVIRGGIFSDKFSTDNAIIKYEVKDYEQIFSMLMANRIDAVIGSTIGLNSTAKKMKISSLQLGAPLILEKKYFTLFLSKKNAEPQKISALKNAIIQLESRGEFLKIAKKYSIP